MIAAYVEQIGRELAFDPALSQRVRREVEDHLREAVATDPAGGGADAERRAVAAFGDAHVIAMQLARVARTAHARRAGALVILVIGSALVAMKARLAWYAVMQWPAGSAWPATGTMVASVDRWAFWLAVVVGLAAFVSIERREGDLRRFAVLCVMATAALGISVAGDAVLTSLRLMGSPWSLRVLVPIVTMGIEIAGVGVLLASVRRVRARGGGYGPASRAVSTKTV